MLGTGQVLPPVTTNREARTERHEMQGDRERRWWELLPASKRQSTTENEAGHGGAANFRESEGVQALFRTKVFKYVCSIIL